MTNIKMDAAARSPRDRDETGSLLVPDKTNAPETMGALVRETYRAMVESVEDQFADGVVTLSQWLTLKLTRDGAIRCVGDVSRELGIETGASTRLLDQLQIRGLIVRQRCGEDRRVVRIFITARGREIVATIHPKLVDFWNEKLSYLSSEEQTDLFFLLGKLRSILLQRR